MGKPQVISGLLLLAVTGLQASVGSVNQPDLQEFVGWEDYIKQWTDTYTRMSKRMYPFSPAYGDSTMNIGNGEGVNIDLGVKFYAVKYRSMFISRDGHFRFSTLAVAPPSKYKDHELPNPLYPEPNQKDPALAAIFYAPHDHNGVLNYRTMRRAFGASDPKSRIDTGQLEQLSVHVQAAVVGADHFQATLGVIATWENATFQGLFVPTGRADHYPMNTYQMVLVTDDVDTFVIFNYYNVTWVGSPSMGCDSETGQPSDSNLKCRGPQIGFNVGEGRHFWPNPYSKSLSVKDLDMIDLKGSDVIGRFFTKVSDAFILRGGCTDDQNIAGPAWPLAISPSSGGMLGGYDVNISAPCFTADRISCRFGDDVTDAVYDGNPMKARCPAPRMRAVGRVKVAVSTDGGNNFRFDTHITVGMMGYVAPSVEVTIPDDDWLNVDKLDLRWDPRAVTWRDVDFIDILLYGYREFATTSEPKWRVLKKVAANIRNDGYWTLDAGLHQCGAGIDAETDCTRYTVGLVVVAIANSDPASSPIALWSDPIPLGWFVRTAAPKYLGADWAHEMCRLWHSEDIKVTNWEDGMTVCPCTLSQAYADWGRFATDVYCNLDNSKKAENCQRHRGAVHCVISSQTTSKGSGSQCCYNAEGDLLYSGDTHFGSTPAKAHPWGTPPYGRTPYIPTLSHWFWDVAPMYACCAWQKNDYDCFNLYVPRRTTTSCKTYQPPAIAAAFGDPHMRTFDGAVYTFNGQGEFLLMHVGPASIRGVSVGLVLQARLQQPRPLSWGVPQATAITAVVMQETRGGTDGAILEIQRNNYAPYDRRLLVYVNGDLTDFREAAMVRQDFPDFIIINNDPPTERVHGNFTVIFRASGIGIQVAHKNGLIHVITVIPPDFRGLTEGLMGIWDGNRDNDIQPRGGGPTIPPDDIERIHAQVGLSWQIGESESRFTYWAKLNRDYYEDRNFKPEFSPKFPANKTGGITTDDVTRVCGTNVPCQYDYMVTLDAQVAEDTLQVQAWTQQQVEHAQLVATCGWLDIPSAIKRQPLKYTPGSVVYIDGCRSGFKLEGATQYTCVGAGTSARWQPDINTRCVDLTDAKKAEAQLAIAVGVPAGIIFLLIVIGILGLICYLRQKRRDRALEKKEAPPDIMPRHDNQYHDSHADNMELEKPGGKRPRPSRRPDDTNLPLSRSNDDLSMYGTRRMPTKPFSASLDNLDNDHDVSMATSTSTGKDTVDLDTSNQSGASNRKPSRPYNYPRNTDTVQDRRRAPYNYPQNRDNFTPEERALIEMRTRQYNE